MKFGFSWPDALFQRRYLKTHPHILAHQNTKLRVVPDEVGGGELGALKAKHYYIFVGVAGMFVFLFFFSIQWAVGFCENA